MVARIAAAFVAFVAATATGASVIPRDDNVCNTGPVQCCNQVQKASHGETNVLLDWLNLVVDPDVLVGLNCSPIDVLGAAANKCSAAPVCCENSSYGGLVNIGCVPVSL